MKRWQIILTICAVLIAGYYLTIPIVGPHFAEVCSKGEYGPPDQCSSWDIVTASILRLFVWLDGHNGLIAALASILIAAFTGVLWSATDKMWSATSGQLALGRDEYLSGNRPKVRIKHLWLAGDISQGQLIKINLGIVNTGTTDAILHQYGIRFSVVSKGEHIPFDPHIPDRPIGGNTLVPGVWLKIPDLTDGTALSALQIMHIRLHEAALYCVGYVSYLDAADRMRITGFCRELVFIGDTLSDTKNCRFRTFLDPDYEYED